MDLSSFTLSTLVHLLELVYRFIWDNPNHPVRGVDGSGIHVSPELARKLVPANQWQFVETNDDIFPFSARAYLPSLVPIRSDLTISEFDDFYQEVRKVGPLPDVPNWMKPEYQEREN